MRLDRGGRWWFFQNHTTSQRLSRSLKSLSRLGRCLLAERPQQVLRLQQRHKCGWALSVNVCNAGPL